MGKTNDVQMKLFPRNTLCQSAAKENALSPRCRNTQRLFDGRILIFVYLQIEANVVFLERRDFEGIAFVSRSEWELSNALFCGFYVT